MFYSVLFRLCFCIFWFTQKLFFYNILMRSTLLLVSKVKIIEYITYSFWRLHIHYFNYILVDHKFSSRNKISVVPDRESLILWAIYLILSYLILSYLILSYLILSYLLYNSKRIYIFLDVMCRIHRSAKLQSPPLSVLFFCSCDDIYQTGSAPSFVFTRSHCHLTIITLIHWIKIDHVLL